MDTVRLTAKVHVNSIYDIWPGVSHEYTSKYEQSFL